jgi:hypothetical protein
MPHRWLEGDPCWAPCVEGITPGRTTLSEARAILDQHPFIGLVTISPTDSEVNMSGELKWQWQDNSPGGLVHYLLAQPQTVVSVIPLNPNPIQLQDVIDAYGVPSHIIATARLPDDYERNLGQPEYGLSLVYLHRGFWLNAVQSTLSEKPMVHPNLMVEVPRFFPTGQQGFLQTRQLVAPQELVAWQGFQSFEFYCRDTRGGSACRSNPFSQYVFLGGGSLIIVGLIIGWMWKRRR